MAIDITPTLRRALTDLEAEKGRIGRQIEAIQTALGTARGTRRAVVRRDRKPMSAAARREVSRRMKAYWAKRRAKKSQPAKAARTTKAKPKAE